MTKGEIFKKLPPTTQIAIVVIGVAVAGGVGYLIYRKIKSMIKLADSREELDSVKKEARSQKLPATLSQAQMNMIANNLFTAMDGYGTNMDTIYSNIAKLKNNADVLGVISAFGIREISSGKGNPAPNFKGALGSAFADELAKEQINAINLVLAKKGISYRF